jgi:8-oxo-dGTP pyrophosphatase MutT (NUDIX family)
VGISPYLAGIRSRIGHDLLLTPSAALALFDADGKIMLARHVHDGRWGIPGGAVEPREAPREAAQRELAEEVGLRADNLELIGAYGGPHFLITYGNGDEMAYVAILYGSRNWSGDVTLQADEIHEIGWFTENAAAKLDLCPTMRPMVLDAFAWLRALSPGT